VAPTSTNIAIGPGGITVIDTKNCHGKVRVGRAGGLFSEQRTILTIANRAKTKLVDGVERQMAALASLLSQADRNSIALWAALSFANVEGLPLLHHLAVRNVIVDGPRSPADPGRSPASRSTRGRATSAPLSQRADAAAEHRNAYTSQEERRACQRRRDPRDKDRRLRRLPLRTSLALGQVDADSRSSSVL
jgi:hypothetical protein